MIQFRKNGEAFLYDLGSTHGTILNGGAPISSKAYKRIMAGDSVRFGTSSKLFVFEGGPDRDEVQSSNPVDKLAKQLKTPSNASSSSSTTSTTSTPSTSKSTTDASGYVVPQAKRRFGQAGGIKKNADDGEEDPEARMEAHLNNKKRQRPRTDDDDDDDGGNASDEEREDSDLQMVMGYLGREAVEGSDADDNFYDLASQKSSANASSAGPQRPETFESVGAKLRTLSFVTNAVKDRIATLEQIISTDIKRRGGSGDDDELDALDAFMSGMSQTVEEEEEREKKQSILKELELDEKNLRKLEQQLKPAPGEISLAITSASELDFISDSYYNELTERVRKTGGSVKLQAKALLPEPKRPKLAEPQSDVRHSSIGASKPHYITADHVIQREETVPPKSIDSASEFKAPTSLPAASPTVAAPETPKIREPPKMSFDNGDGSDNTYQVWQAPAGQTGDGRTALNDKFGY